jgi:uncharacterized protein (DUF1800 family)
MNDREKIAHLLRRLGLGASRTELATYEPLGVNGAIDRLVRYDQVEEGFPVAPTEFWFEEGKEEIYLDPPRVSAWWALRMAMTKRPLQEKLTLFWHDHFAVSAAKVEFGPAMLKYNETLRKNACGKFEELLRGVAKDPAMIRFLDTDRSMKGSPNENFARELLELFTLGRGHYTETDIKECAKAFTGWGIRYLIFEQGGEYVQAEAKKCVADSRDMIVFANSPDLHDESDKTILGRTGKFDGDSVLSMLAGMDQTAMYIGTKLWEFFAYANPEQAVRERIARTFKDSKGDIRSTMLAIAKSPEFFSEKAVLTKVKSPVDFVIPLLRQIDVATFLTMLRPASSTKTTPVPQPMRELAGGLVFLMSNQGMLLLYPPDVGGWEWGDKWISSDIMSQRIGYGTLFFGSDRETKELAQNVGRLVLAGTKPTDAAGFVAGLLELFDAKVPTEKQRPLVEACQSHGGIAAIESQAKASEMVGAVMTLLFATPEFHLC